MADPSGPQVAEDPDTPDTLTPADGGPLGEGAAATGASPGPAEADAPPRAPEAAPLQTGPSQAAPEPDAGATSVSTSTEEPVPPDADTDAATEATAATTPVRQPEPPDHADDDDDVPVVEDDVPVVEDDDDLDNDLDDDDLYDDDLDDDEEGPKRRGGLLTKQVQVDARMILAIVAVLALFAGAYVLGQRQGESAPDTQASGPTASTIPPLPKDFLPFEDKDTGVKLAYPKDWAQVSTKDLDASYRLLVSVPKSKDNFRVRVNAYSSEVTKANVADQKAVIDAIFSEEKITILSDTVVEVNGLPALFYVYKFTDSTGEPGYHAHFFVFQGRKMVSLVFEAIPEARYGLLAPVFDAVANSLQVAPGEPPAFLQELTGTETTVPGATTVPPVVTTKQP